MSSEIFQKKATDKGIELLPPQLNASKIRLDGIFIRDNHLHNWSRPAIPEAAPAAYDLLLEIGSDARCRNQTLHASLNCWPSSFLIQDQLVVNLFCERFRL